MAWLKRKDKGIQTPTEEKKESPDGLWFKTPNGKLIHTRELKNNCYVVPEDNYHVRIGSAEYFELLFDNNKFTELDKGMQSVDPLEFVDTKPYPARVKATQQKNQAQGCRSGGSRQDERTFAGSGLHGLRVYWRVDGLSGGRKRLPAPSTTP